MKILNGKPSLLTFIDQTVPRDRLVTPVLLTDEKNKNIQLRLCQVDLSGAEVQPPYLVVLADAILRSTNEGGGLIIRAHQLGGLLEIPDKEIWVISEATSAEIVDQLGKAALDGVHYLNDNSEWPFENSEAHRLTLEQLGHDIRNLLSEWLNESTGFNAHFDL